MIRYRPFRNSDPPLIQQIWNDSGNGRGACTLKAVSPLERSVFSKLYFDPAGLILALDDANPIGFIHAGFGPNAEQSGTDREVGVICALGVRPPYRGHGVGAELLRHAEDYLRGHGATVVYAGPRRPRNPFFFGIYGGSDSPGFLISDGAAGLFLERQGYTLFSRTSVLQRKLENPLMITDPRFPQLRKRFEVTIQPKLTLESWWQENTIGCVEPVEIRLEDRANRAMVGRTLIWEMELFSWRWNLPAAGILDLQVRENLRRQGLGRFFLAHVVRYLQEQYFGVCECQVDASNIAGRSLLESMGFEVVDEGRVYQKRLT